MTLALLLTAVGGAWAQDYDINVDFNSTYDRMGTTFNCMIMNLIDPGVGVKGTLELSVDGVSKGSFGVDGDVVFGSIAALDAGDYTWSAVFKPEGGGSFNRNGNFTIEAFVVIVDGVDVLKVHFFGLVDQLSLFVQSHRIGLNSDVDQHYADKHKSSQEEQIFFLRMQRQIREQLRRNDQAQNGETDRDKQVLGRMYSQIVSGESGEKHI